MQLQLSPVILRSGEATVDKADGDHSSQGHLMLTGLQFRGHAMFSEIDRPIGCDTLEYAWLIEVQCGTLTGKINATQLYNIVVSAETLAFLTVDKESVLKHPRPYKLCQHNANQKECRYLSPAQSAGKEVCQTVDELKYKLIRFSADSIDLSIAENSTLLRLQCCPLR